MAAQLQRAKCVMTVVTSQMAHTGRTHARVVQQVHHLRMRDDEKHRVFDEF